MTYPQASSRYATQFQDLVLALDMNPERTIKVDCVTPKNAQKLRFQFYAYRNMERKAAKFVEGETLDVIEVSLDGSACIFQTKDYSPLAELLTKGLSAAGITTYRRKGTDSET